MQMAETIMDNDDVDIVISDQSNDAHRVYSNLNRVNLFHTVYWRANSAICRPESNIFKTLEKIKCIVFGLDDAEIINNQYDELVYYNADVYIYGIYDKLKLKNKNLICSRYEEGILSYEDSKFLKNSRLNICNTIRWQMKKTTLDEETQNFYCFYPEFYKGNLTPIAVPKIADCRVIGNKLKELFDVDDEKLIINEKYIFFTSVYDFEGGAPIGETELVQQVAEIVGKENLIVKTHPRDMRNVFKKLGIHVYEHSEIPWEAIQLNNNFSSKVLLTVNSGSVIGANMITEKKAEAMFLYKCCNYQVNLAAVETSQTIDRFISEFSLEGIKAVESLDELKK